MVPGAEQGARKLGIPTFTKVSYEASDGLFSDASPLSQTEANRLVLKQVHPDRGISNHAMSILNSFCNDIFERLAKEAGDLAKKAKKSTINTREMSAAAKLILPGDLFKHGETEGRKALTSIHPCPLSFFPWVDLWLIL